MTNLIRAFLVDILRLTLAFTQILNLDTILINRTVLEGDQAVLMAYTKSFLLADSVKEEGIFVPSVALAASAIVFRDSDIYQAYEIPKFLAQARPVYDNFAADVRFQSALCSANLAFIKSLRLAEISNGTTCSPSPRY